MKRRIHHFAAHATVVTTLLLSLPAHACEKLIAVKLSQTHLTFDLAEHAKDAMNAVEFYLPVSCAFHDTLKVGDNLISKNFRSGSFWIRGSVGVWSLTVVRKESPHSKGVPEPMNRERQSRPTKN